MIPRPLNTLRRLNEEAAQRSLIDYEATRRAFARQEILRQYADWVNVGDIGAPAFTNGWSNYTPNAAYDGYLGEARPPIGFFRDRWGNVHLRGMAANSALTTAPIFRLPAELWPDEDYYMRGYYTTEGTGGLVGTYYRYTCLITADELGYVYVQSYFDATNFSGAKFVTLNGAEFQAANKGNPV